MSVMNGTAIAASNTTTVAIGTVPVTKAASPDSSQDPKVVAAYVCFGVGAFIIIVAVMIIIIFLCRRRSRQKKQLQRSSLNLDDYKFAGTGNHPISTISDSEGRLTKTAAPDYNFTVNGYRFPLGAIADQSVLSQRHPLDDESALPAVLQTSFIPLSNADSNSPYPSRSSVEISTTTESGMAETEGYVRLHRSSPLAGINAIYSSSGELSADYENTPRKTDSSESRDRVRDVSKSRRFSSKKRDGNQTENVRNLGNGSRFIGAVNEGFVSDDYYDAPKVMVRNSSLRTSLDRLKRDRVALPPSPLPRSQSSRKSSVLLENSQMQNGVYHVSLRHDGSSVTQTSVVKHPT